MYKLKRHTSGNIHFWRVCSRNDCDRSSHLGRWWFLSRYSSGGWDWRQREERKRRGGGDNDVGTMKRTRFLDGKEAIKRWELKTRRSLTKRSPNSRKCDEKRKAPKKSKLRERERERERERDREREKERERERERERGRGRREGGGGMYKTGLGKCTQYLIRHEYSFRESSGHENTPDELISIGGLDFYRQSEEWEAQQRGQRRGSFGKKISDFEAFTR